jgi:dTDP-N-acetylfucosamine:lipid II N-acetylfucosaminyltransferase
MSKGIILHLCALDKFIEPFYGFTKKSFAKEFDRHIFYIKRGKSSHAAPVGINVLCAEKIGKLGRYILLMRHMHSSEKIILHGLFDYQALLLLFINPWLLKKCYWAIWGGDLYCRANQQNNVQWIAREIIRKIIIKKIGHFITHIKGDYDLAKKWYGGNGVWHECFMYPSNLFQDISSQPLPHEGINILLGNSSDPSNNHIEVLDKLKSQDGENIRIYCPLSYGDQTNAQKVSDYGESLFGSKFIPIRNFMRIEKYNELLAKIDIAIFNHNRQQGMGNTTSLLGMGKKVFMREEVTPYVMFKNIGIKVYSINNLNLNLIDENIARANIMAVKKYFSIDKLREQWERVYD